jgi:MFS family permease
VIDARALAGRTFRSLRIRNYRLYFFGQIVSLTGTWMQSVAQGWLVLTLTGSGVALGVTMALQFGPILLAGPWGGLIADRADKRRLLVFTQAASGALALTLGLLVVTGEVRLWMVFVLAVLLGTVNLVDMPTRQSFVTEMVGRDVVANAVSLNSVLVNGARVVGPALAGVLIAAFGTGVCFLVNGGSYLAVIAGLMLMDPEKLKRSRPVPRGRGQLRAGLHYVWTTPELRTPLLLMAVVGTLAYNFAVVLPLLARFSFGGGAGTLGALYSLMGVGAVGGGLVIAARARATQRLLAGAALVFGVVLWLLTLAPSLPLAMAAMVPIGAASTAFIATSNSLLQLGSTQEMRGRVMALFSVVFLGSTPIGALTVGWIAERFGPRVALGVGAGATLLAGAVALAALRVVTRRARRGGWRQDPVAAAAQSVPR